MMLHVHLHHDVCKVCVSGMDSERCVEFLDKPGSSLGVPHGCCALRRKRSNNKGLIQRDETQRDRAKVVSGIYMTENRNNKL